MQLIIGAPFDLGLTIGLENQVLLAPDKLRALKAASETIFGAGLSMFHQVMVASHPEDVEEPSVYDISALPYGVRNPYGFGVRFGISSGPLTELWSANAKSFWRRHGDSLRKEFGDVIYEQVRARLELTSIRRASLFLFSLGVCYVRLHIDLEGPIPGAAVRGIYKAYEFAGYGDLLPGEETANAMLFRWREAVREVYGRRSEIASITGRTVRPDYIEIAGFESLVLIPDKTSGLTEENSIFRPGDARVDIRYGDLEVTASWYLTLARGTPGFEYDHPRLLYITMCYQLAWEICRVFEEVFTEKVRLSIIASIEGQGAELSRKQLNRIRQFAAFVLSITVITNLSDYSGDTDLAKFYDSYGNLNQRHARINLAASSLAEVEADMVVSEERKLARSLNFTLLALTVLSLIGVSAAVVSAWRDGIQIFSDPALFLSVPAAPSLLAMLTILSTRMLRR
ncbi:MAG: hypothetical protein HC850_01355 [Rhodomicrobium sp.]|nr:hypothetical protein [Rhodomicrobium sp.]